MRHSRRAGTKGGGCSPWEAQAEAQARPVPVTLNGAGANSIDPFFSSVFYYVPPGLPEGHGQLRPGR